MFNWFMKKNETVSQEPTVSAQEQPSAPPANRASRQSSNAAGNDTDTLIDAALDQIELAEKNLPAIKQKLLALIEDGTPRELLLSVLGALAANPAPQSAPQPSQRPSLISNDSSDKFPAAGFYEFLAWIEDTESYQRLYTDTLRQPPPDTCCFCGGNPDTSAPITLLNGWRVHEKCHSLLISNLQKLKSVLEARLLFDASPNVMSAFRFINTWWPGSPPDWQVRRKTIITRAKERCEDCGKPNDGSLEAHYIKPIEKGGNHALDNLICLCSACRSQYVLDETLGTEDADHKRRTYYQQKVNLLDLACEEGRDVRFTYRDDRDVISIRTITPREWRDRNGALYIIGFCYLLNDTGAFDIRAMTELSIV